MTLDVAIPTHRHDGPARFVSMLPPTLAGVRYVLSWQDHGNALLPRKIADRKDIVVVRCEETGVSANRNNALRHCTADVVLFGDDDIKYDACALEAVKQAFASRPDMQVAFIRYLPHEKAYPLTECEVKGRWPKGYYAGAPEIAVRRNVMFDFNTRIGPGTQPFSTGEDSLWAMQALYAHKLKCYMLPITVGTHQGVSTGNRPISDPGIAQAMGALIRLEYQISWPLRIVLKAYRLWRNGQCSFAFALKKLTKGARLANNLRS